MRVLVAAWSGSTNLGDELVLAGCLTVLRRAGAEPVVVSVDPDGTRREHGVQVVDGGRPDAVWEAAGEVDALVFGGGGLLQDETSALNLPYHLSRVWAARLRGTPVVGLGLGAGRLRTRLGRELVRRSLAGARLSVRDAPSAALLHALGLPAPTVAADLALELPAVDRPPMDRLVVSLRPWSGVGRRLVPVGARVRRPADESQLAATARALDAAAAATGLTPHLVALQADRDGPLHDAVAQRMRAPVTTSRPQLADLPAEVASGRAVVAMRYHGGVAAVLAGRPAVLIGYSPKVDALAAELGAGGRLLPWRPDGPDELATALQTVLGRGADVVAARERLRERSRRHDEVLTAVLGTARG